MRHERVYLDDRNELLISYHLYNKGSDNRPERARMKRVLSRAIKYELTERQRSCITMHYLEGMKMTEIARSLNLSKSTVSRHIKAATHKLRKIAAYYEKLN